jgi:ABC-type multidrug transport system ATPase subunit
MDEPTAGLDALSKRNFLSLLRRLQGRTTVFMTSVNGKDIESVCNRSAIITRGRVVGIGSPSYLRQSYAEGYRVCVLIGQN